MRRTIADGGCICRLDAGKSIRMQARADPDSAGGTADIEDHNHLQAQCGRWPMRAGKGTPGYTGDLKDTEDRSICRLDV